MIPRAYFGGIIVGPDERFRVSPTIRSAATVTRVPPAFQSARILVVDDHVDDLDLAREILEDEGYSVECAADGRAALDRLHRGPLPDLLMIDLIMPVMDGWRLIAELKERPALAAIPVVVTSAGGARAFSSAPASAAYLEKPISPSHMLETLAACLARRGRAPTPTDGGVLGT